jgi:hypothetical protein
MCCRHENIVPALAYCAHPPCLVYPLFEAGSLHDVLNDGAHELANARDCGLRHSACVGVLADPDPDKTANRAQVQGVQCSVLSERMIQMNDACVQRCKARERIDRR